jgi:hypothetical protein
MVLGLALVLALLFGVASMVFAANGNSFVLGVLNNSATTVTRLVGNVNGSTLQVLNTNAGTDDTALDLKVQAGEAPMTVNSGKVVSNLNADKIDGKDSSALLTRDAFLSATVLNNGDLIVTSHSGTAATKDRNRHVSHRFPAQRIQPSQLHYGGHGRTSRHSDVRGGGWHRPRHQRGHSRDL